MTKKEQNKKKKKPTIPIGQIISAIMIGVTAYIAFTESNILYAALCLLLILSTISSLNQKRKEHFNIGQKERYCVQIYDDNRKSRVVSRKCVDTIDDGLSWMKQQHLFRKRWDIFDTRTGKVVKETKE